MEAIDKSIKKWEGILCGDIALKEATSICPLCEEYECGVPHGKCKRCPLSASGANCLDNQHGPWEQFRRALATLGDARYHASMHELDDKSRIYMQSHARRMLDALRSARMLMQKRGLLN